ncbi:hypothetical protein B0O99DRAFT_618775 [Bisporella sp. PMI_857]|nr:hypothetical protein B0O99DRAFT_618775 [Bisporella sp. PMI_857]
MDAVTIEKSYFETLMRRAQFHTNGIDYSTPESSDTVTIPKLEHDSLLESARQLANLRRNLFRGGALEATLAILMQDESNLEVHEEPDTDQANKAQNRFTTSRELHSQRDGSRNYTYGQNSVYTPRNPNMRASNASYHDHNGNEDYAFSPDGGEYENFDGESVNHDFQPRPGRPQYVKHAKRSLLLANLPESVTHSDITDVVRGGMLLDIYLRSHERTATVSFLEETDAQKFFQHVKRHDLYIKCKRVVIRWADRQFILPSHVANKVSIGATRNLIIRNRTPRHTEDSIRNDLEHIHNLVVIKIAFMGQNIYVSTNSVHNSMFARTCLMSRVLYKGSKIDWDVDECAKPLVTPERPHSKVVAVQKKETSLMNRFQLLNMDTTGDGSSDTNDGDDDDGSGIILPSTVIPSTKAM